MPVGFDPNAISSTTPPPQTVVQPRSIPIQAPGARPKTGDSRQQDKSKDNASFRASLEQVASAESFAAEAQARKIARAIDAQRSARAEKRPDPTPAEVTAGEGADLFAETVSHQARTTGGVRVPSSQEFVTAASRYAERFFSVKGAYAKTGESVELSA